MNYALWNKLFRYEVIAPLRFEQFEVNIGEDTLFNIAALCRSRTMVTTGYVGYDYTVHAMSATGRSSKGMPYLRTLVQSGDRIRETLAEEDGSAVGRKFADRISLKRFATGCEWIAEQPDSEEKSAQWSYWRRYLVEQLLPDLESQKLLAWWFSQVANSRDAATAGRMMRTALKLTDPLRVSDKIEARRVFKRLSHKSS